MREVSKREREVYLLIKPLIIELLGLGVLFLLLDHLCMCLAHIHSQRVNLGAEDQHVLVNQQVNLLQILFHLLHKVR